MSDGKKVGSSAAQTLPALQGGEKTASAYGTPENQPRGGRRREIVAHFWKRAQERDNVEVDTDGDIVYYRVTELTAAERVLFPELEACSFIEMYLLNNGEVFAWIEL